MSRNKLISPKLKLALIGLGPFAKRHYVNFFKQNNVFPEFIVDLQSKRVELTQFLESHQLNIPLLLIPDEERNALSIEGVQRKRIEDWIQQHEITHAIIATEAKAHFVYLKLLINLGIHILVEKPLTAPQQGSFSFQAAEQVEKDYEDLLEKIRQSPNKHLRVDIQCHRRYHPVYQFINEQIRQFVQEFDIPITYCDIYHSDGVWNMPNEFLSREDHPYSYGFGKLFHSGYHFIDLLAMFLKSSFCYCSKSPDSVEMYGTDFSPLDSLAAFNQKDYERFFSQMQHMAIHDNPYGFGFSGMGELDFFSTLQLMQEGRKITTCTLNLLQTGFSRRAWNHLPLDTYKGNGRVRHERANIQFGPLLNIQVHSYTSDQADKASFDDPFAIGNPRHFDVLIFRNADLVGGEVFTKISSDELGGSIKQSHNEFSRLECLWNFLLDKPSLTSLADHGLGIKFLSKALKTLCRGHADQPPIERFLLKKEDLNQKAELHQYA